MNIKSYIRDSIDTKTKILNNETILSTINKIVDEITEAYKKDKKVLTAGNGGSAGDAQHIACELVSGIFSESSGMSAFALNANTSVLTAIGNDYSYEKIFSRQIQANAKKGDIFIAISTSGNSENIIAALYEAQKRGLVTVGLTGEKECKMDKYCDYIIHVPSRSTPTIQESHIMIGHIICALVEKAVLSMTKEQLSG